MAVRLVVGGGIGSGKSTVTAIFGSFGAHVIESDAVARSTLAPGSRGARAVEERWPEVVVDGTIDRAGLGRLAFADPAILAELESITHPETRRLILAEAARHPERPVVVEMPLLRDWFDEWSLVVVDAPEAARIERVLARDDRAMDEEEVRLVMQRQPSRGAWLAAADYVVANDGDRSGLETRCRRVWDRLHGH